MKYYADYILLKGNTSSMIYAVSSSGYELYGKSVYFQNKSVRIAPTEVANIFSEFVAGGGGGTDRFSI